ncbi:hypothetical protein YTPLAS18_05850 [Nitrospira sp.]|nr:hypothetical protein YTPLAS18_05850 [Nitrospira sp.]
MRTLICAGLMVGALFVTVPAEAQEGSAGHVDWESWEFDWEVKGNTGLALRNVTFKDELVLGKASMPVLRVKYEKEQVWWNPFSWFGTRAETGRCGPFQDRISWSNIVPIEPCGGNKVCIRAHTIDGLKWIELGVYARIGEYHIYQAWLLSEDGEIHPVVNSRGLSCVTDHIHHPYWRLDFDVAGSGLDQVFVHNEGAADEGWGPGWHKYTNELNTFKNHASHRVWFVRDHATGHGVWVFPGYGYEPLKDDGVRDDFSNRDVSVRRARAEEDVPWSFGARGDLAFDGDHEGIQEQDIVFWYVAHLPHMAVMGPLKWLAIGPVVRVHQ